MKIIKINKKDRYFYEIVNHCFQWYGENDQNKLKKIEESAAKAIIDDSIPNLYALIVNDLLIGFYGINEKDGIDEYDYTPYVANIYIKEEYRGQGYSKYLIEDAKKNAKSMGYTELYLHSRHENYYEKFNFELIKTVKTKDGEKRIFKTKLK